MKTKFQQGNIKLLVKTQPIATVEIHNGNELWFATTNPRTLLDVSRVIADFAKELNKEGVKNMEEHNKAIK